MDLYKSFGKSGKVMRENCFFISKVKGGRYIYIGVVLFVECITSGINEIINRMTSMSTSLGCFSEFLSQLAIIRKYSLRGESFSYGFRADIFRYSCSSTSSICKYYAASA